MRLVACVLTIITLQHAVDLHQRVAVCVRLSKREKKNSTYAEQIQNKTFNPPARAYDSGSGSDTSPPGRLDTDLDTARRISAKDRERWSREAAASSRALDTELDTARRISAKDRERWSREAAASSSALDFDLDTARRFTPEDRERWLSEATAIARDGDLDNGRHMSDEDRKRWLREADGCAKQLRLLWPGMP